MPEGIKQREITEEMQQAYLEYAMSVIVARALPDVRDGLKPVHRRILYAMHEMGLRPGAKYQKSAKVVGYCMGQFHPHGDMAIYDSLVRMAQDFSLRYPLVDGQGNFGCFTGDTKVKLANGKSLSFKEMAQEYKGGKKLWGFTFNPNSKKVELAEIKEPRLTRKKSELVQVEIDNGSKIRCTSDHRFMLRSGEYRQAKDLTEGDSLMPAYFNTEQIKVKRKHLAYLSVLQPFTGHYEFVHKLADGWNDRNGTARKFVSSFILHHKNFNRWDNSPENIVRMTWEEHYKIHFDQSKNLWKEKGHLFKEKHRQSLKLAFSSPEIRKKMSDRSKQLWLDPEYRNKYPSGHFKNAAFALWEKPGIKEFHREKISKQWQETDLKEKLVAGVITSNKKRISNGTLNMKELASKSREVLLKNWKSSDYKEGVIRSKILGYVYGLLRKYSKVTKEIYERERYNNYIPKIDKALTYFDSFSDILEKAPKYNHKVVGVEYLPTLEDVFDVTVEPWHNFLLDAGVFVHNSIDNDPAAAQRYTECRMAPMAEELLSDIEKDTVDFQDNYDASVQEPKVLPSKVPNLLINGSMGIAVGMATNIPPHNLSEILDALAYLSDNSDAQVDDLMQFVKGPDFPTGGVIYNESDIHNAYVTGRGPIVMRGKAEITEGKRGFQIIVAEIPYQVNKSELIRNIADLVKDKKIDGIKDVRDESDKDGLRIAIDLKQDAFPRKVLNQLFKYTELQKSFHFNMLALVDGIQPQVLGLKGMLEKFIDHRKEVVTKRAKFDLRKAKDRAHILEGLKKALDHIDEIIAIIKKSESKEDAFNNLIKKFKFSEKQASAILEMKLQALAGLERKKINDELQEKKELIARLEDLLASPKKILGVVKDEFKSLREKYGDERKTKVVKSPLKEIGEEELVPEENSLFMITRDGYIKRMAPDVLRSQKRGGKGLIGIATKEEDIVSHFFLASTHDNLLFFTNLGKVFQTKGYEVPESSRQSKGKAIVNFLQISLDEKITAVVPIPKGQKRMYLFMATEHGVIKKVEMDALGKVRQSGMIAIKLKGDDRLGWVMGTSGDDQIIMTTSDGNAIRFKEKDVRPMGRGAAGVIGVRLEKGNRVVGADVVMSGAEKGLRLLVVMENGYGKRTDLKFYKIQKRGGRGIMTAKITSKTGKLVSAHITSEENKELIAVSRKGVVIRTSIESISVLGRATQGVRVMKVESGDGLASVVVV